MFDTYFRTLFREFSNTTKYPTAAVSSWYSVSLSLLKEDAFNDAEYARALFVAHNLALQDQAIAATTTGGAPGYNDGAVSSKSIGSASVSYDTGSSVYQDAGWYNQTSYGRRLYGMIRLCAGCIQI